MSHDLVMMIYGALIGVGSSIVTTLFQSWLNRKERERQQKEEQKRKLQAIYTPTVKEVQEIVGNIHSEKGIAIGPNARAVIIEIESIFYHHRIVRIIISIIFGGIVFLVFRIDNPILYLAAAALFGFALTYIITTFLKS